MYVEKFDQTTNKAQHSPRTEKHTPPLFTITMHSSPFTVAGMPLNSSTSSSHAQHSTSTPNLHTWGSGSLSTSTGPGAGPTGHVGFGGGGGGMGASGMGGAGPGMTTSFSDSHSLAQSRGHYQAGYLMVGAFPSPWSAVD